MRDPLLVSCLCVTRDRVPLLQRSVACFLNQTYPHRELDVVYEADDTATRNFLSTLRNPAIRALEVPVQPRMNLGQLRNFALRSSRGHYVAQWDDDDWHGPARLSEQIGAMGASGRPACVLKRWVIFDETDQAGYLSGNRAWEGSLVATRDCVPDYADLTRGEDTPVIARMIANGSLAFLDRPDLYIYVFHGSNTWDQAHWKQNIIAYATPLNPLDVEKVKALLGAGH